MRGDCGRRRGAVVGASLRASPTAARTNRDSTDFKFFFVPDRGRDRCAGWAGCGSSRHARAHALTPPRPNLSPAPPYRAPPYLATHPNAPPHPHTPLRHLSSHHPPHHTPTHPTTTPPPPPQSCEENQAPEGHEDWLVCHQQFVNDISNVATSASICSIRSTFA